MEEEEEGGMKRRRLVVRLRWPRRPAILPDELMVEIISWLPVKHVMQLRCVNKFFRNLIFDPHFVQMHLNKSARAPNLQQLVFNYSKDNIISRVETLSIPRLLRNKSPIFHRRRHDRCLLNDYSHIQRRSYRMQRLVDSCNGLVCLFGVSLPFGHQWLRFWNPAMRTKSKKFPMFFDYWAKYYFNFSLGYDNSTRTYKVVAFCMKYHDAEPILFLKVLSLGDDHNSCWRDIQCCFPVMPLYLLRNNYKTISNKGAHLNGTINWIVLRDYNINSSRSTLINVNQYVILSLDLSTEKCTQLLLPQRFDKKLWHTPKLRVLMGCLCFCHDFEETYFAIWQMKIFGVQESWVPLFQISYQGNFSRWVNLWPLYLSENHNTLILANDDEVHPNEAFIYSHKRNKVHKIEMINDIWWSGAINYVESLVSIH